MRVVQEPQALQNGRLQRRSERTHCDRLSRGWQEQAGSGSWSFQVGLMFHNKRGLLLGKRSTLAQPVYPDGGLWPLQSVVFEHVTTDRTNAGRVCGNSADPSVSGSADLYGR